MSQPTVADAVKPDRVHKKVFTDPEIFALEMTRIFRRSWIYLGHTSEVPEPGSFKRTWLGLAPILLTRNADGAIGAMINACRHRGATVCEEDSGRRSQFTCPYHGWSYSIDGDLVGVPMPAGQRSSFQKAEWGLHRVPRVEIYRGFVFGCMDPGVVPLPDYLGNARSFLDDFVDLSPTGEIVVDRGASRYEYRGNWKQQVENSMDGYHPAIVHHSFFEGVLPHRTGKGFGWLVGEQSPGKSYSLGNGHALLDFRFFDRSKILGAGGQRGAAELEWNARLVQRLGAARAEQVMAVRGGDGFNLLVYPNLVLINCQIRVIRPIAVDRTEVLAYPTMLAGVDDSLNVDRLRGHEDFYGAASFGAPDDIDMFVRQWEGLATNPEIDWLPYERHGPRAGRRRRRAVLAHRRRDRAARDLAALAGIDGELSRTEHPRERRDHKLHLSREPAAGRRPL
jgi:phenylpropionate dioxygenase-like ring-hydroxylating dioxygenase large terminal subunit